MKIASYNIQFGIGLDGKYDPQRIAAELGDADIIGLQEVTRGFPRNEMVDLPAIMSSLFPEFHHAFGAGFATDAGSQIVDGRMHMRHFEFGNMVLSRYPILAIRNILLPRTRTFDKMNMQRSALECLVATPDGPLRVYSVHLDHRNPEERISQIRYLKDRVIQYGIEGGALTGTAEFGFVDPPHADDYVIMGDFNMMPEQPEYLAMVGAKDLYYGRTPRATDPIDAIAHLGRRKDGDYTWEEPGHPEIRQYLDYLFVSPTLLPRLKGGWVDVDAAGSDHKPVWLEIG
ncbi:endonuclease/exonuclease/phosphatase family protein [Rhizobium alvei]|uniref:Endonuclease/exonuclease/phosphatase family protein n=1 Tax=Rhizobium alvei TaxID=1132659 RepID=A0ABT8YLU1_9HYPH|nr:endonuclease/exonuclease/phosphatase family protein [Rhizobium alvei]MDO6964574.1 endonuclease/exonuclease/phosphatase family protein [Rhizobium alvei]